MNFGDDRGKSWQASRVWNIHLYLSSWAPSKIVLIEAEAEVKIRILCEKCETEKKNVLNGRRKSTSCDFKHFNNGLSFVSYVSSPESRDFVLTFDSNQSRVSRLKRDRGRYSIYEEVFINTRKSRRFRLKNYIIIWRFFAIPPSKLKTVFLDDDRRDVKTRSVYAVCVWKPK